MRVPLRGVESMAEENAFLCSPLDPALVVQFKLKNAPLFTLEPPRDQSACVRLDVHQG